MKSKTKFFLVVLVAFFLNEIWEFSHYNLYYDMSGIPKYPHLLVATFADAVIIAAILLIVSLKNNNLSWINQPRKSDYLIIIILSLIAAISIEITALNFGRWAYKPSMPTILGVGISPLAQLAVTIVLSLLIVKSVRFSEQQH